MYYTEPPTDKTIREWYMNSSRVAACALRNEQAVRAYGPGRNFSNPPKKADVPERHRQVTLNTETDSVHIQYILVFHVHKRPLELILSHIIVIHNLTLVLEDLILIQEPGWRS